MLVPCGLEGQRNAKDGPVQREGAAEGLQSLEASRMKLYDRIVRLFDSWSWCTLWGRSGGSMPVLS